MGEPRRREAEIEFVKTLVVVGVAAELGVGESRRRRLAGVEILRRRGNLLLPRGHRREDDLRAIVGVSGGKRRWNFGEELRDGAESAAA